MVRDSIVHFRADQVDLAAMDRLAGALKATRSDVMRTLVHLAAMMAAQQDPEIERVLRARRRARQTGETLAGAYLWLAAEEIQREEGLPPGDAWIAASRRAPRLSALYQQMCAQASDPDAAVHALHMEADARSDSQRKE